MNKPVKACSPFKNTFHGMQNPSAGHVEPEKNEIDGKYMALTFHIDSF